MKDTLVSMVVVVVVGCAIGLGYNAIRSGQKINIERNYFKVIVVDTDTTTLPDEPAKVPTDDDSEGGFQHPFIPVTVEEVMDIYESSAITGEAIFVDARDQAHFEEERIPGAYNISNYNVDEDFALVEEYLDGPEIIVVYCGGGKCEDSIFLATELVDRGIPMDKIRLFEGGMKAWLNENLDVEQGPANN